MLFYVVSGFLISYALANKYPAGLRGSIAYLQSRFIRYVPRGLYMCLAANRMALPIDLISGYRADVAFFPNYIRYPLALTRKSVTVIYDLSFIRPRHVALFVIKAVSYGAAIPIVAGFCGLRARGSSEGVGWATTAAVIGSSLAVIVLDFLISASALFLTDGDL